jgi:hypothetical protein
VVRSDRGVPTPSGLVNFSLQGVTHPADTYLAMGTTRQRQGSIPSVVSDASVPIEAAGELTSVDVDQIRRWAAVGVLEIEYRGELEVVRLDTVEALSRSPRTPPRDGRYMLRRLLDGVRLDTPSVIELQRIAREREPVTAS